MTSPGSLPFAAIVFDFDGVIADTEKLHLGAFQEVFATRGWTLGEADYFEHYLGYDDRGLIKAFARERQALLDDAALEALVHAKGVSFGRQIAATDVLYPNAKARIRELAQLLPLGIASGALHHEIVSILTTAGLVDAFRVIVAADDVTATKPDPEPYLRAAAMLGVAPSACLAIEDSEPGLRAAHAAGMRTIAVTTTTPRAALALADHIARDLAEITPKLIASLAGRHG